MNYTTISERNDIISVESMKEKKVMVTFVDNAIEFCNVLNLNCVVFEDLRGFITSRGIVVFG